MIFQAEKTPSGTFSFCMPFDALSQMIAVIAAVGRNCFRLSHAVRRFFVECLCFLSIG